MNKIATGLCGLLLMAACRDQASEQPEEFDTQGRAWLSAAQVHSTHLTIEPVTQRPVGFEVSASGKLTFYDLRVSHIFSPVTGRVVRIEAEPGAKLKAGAPLAEIESPDVGGAFADLLKAQAELVEAESELRRQTELYEAHAGAKRDLEAARSNYEKTRAEHQRATEKARLLHALGSGAQAARYVLRSPIEGDVIARNVNPGSEVQGQYSGGTAVELFTVGDLDPIVLVADVFEMDIARVRKGARVNISVPAYPGRVFEGTIDTIYDQLDPVTRTAKVRCLVSNPGHELKPEMFASVSIAAGGETALAIPRSALLRLGDQTVVFVRSQVRGDGAMQFERTPVAVDEDEGGLYLPVKQGLREGEELVTSGAILLSGLVQ